MLRKIRNRLTYANVMSTLAVFIALGGSSYAALKVGTRDIKNNAVRSVDLRNNDVRGKDVRNGTLTGVDVKRDALGGSVIAESRLGKVPAAASADRVGGRSVERAAGAVPGWDGRDAGTCIETQSVEPAALSGSRATSAPCADAFFRATPSSGATCRRARSALAAGRRVHLERLRQRRPARRVIVDDHHLGRRRRSAAIGPATQGVPLRCPALELIARAGVMIREPSALMGLVPAPARVGSAGKRAATRSRPATPRAASSSVNNSWVLSSSPGHNPATALPSRSERFRGITTRIDQVAGARGPRAGVVLRARRHHALRPSPGPGATGSGLAAAGPAEIRARPSERTIVGYRENVGLRRCTRVESPAPASTRSRPEPPA